LQSTMVNPGTMPNPPAEVGMPAQVDAVTS